jgi:hypothetical protein
VVADELDLHGFALEAAEHRLEAFLETHAVRTPGGVSGYGRWRLPGPAEGVIPDRPPGRV